MSDELGRDEDLLGKKSVFNIKEKSWIFKVGAIATVAIIMWVFVKILNPPTTLEQKVELKPLTLKSNLLAEDEFEKFKAGLDDVDESVSSQNQRLDSLETALNNTLEKLKTDGLKGEELKAFISEQLEKQKPSASSIPDPRPVDDRNLPFGYPPPPIKKSGSTPRVANMADGPKLADTRVDTFVGGTGWTAASSTTLDTKKKTKRYLLPPSMMPAKLLTGIDAMTNKQGKENMEQVFFRIDAPAVLPNHIRRDLTGCFVVANAYGNLAKERVSMQAVTLSCMSRDGKFAIDEDILGFVTDHSDGKRDLTGHVVSKDSSKMAWLVAASVAGEIGNAVTLDTFQQNQNVLGTSTILDADKAVQNSIGSSITSASGSYKEIILEYIKQSGPVVEAAPLKEATICIQEAVWLNIIPTEGEGNTDA